MEVAKQASESDIENLQRVCAAVSLRAAKVAAAGVATIVKVRVTKLSFIFLTLVILNFS